MGLEVENRQASAPAQKAGREAASPSSLAEPSSAQRSSGSVTGSRGGTLPHRC